MSTAPFWHISNPRGEVPGICTASGLHVTDVNGYGATREQNIERAETIIIAVNSHAELVAALELIDSNAAESVEWIRRVARTALEKAKFVT